MAAPAPSYAQSALDARLMTSSDGAQRPDSDADVSSIADISTTVHSDTDDGEVLASTTADRKKRGFLESVKSRLHSRQGNASSPYSRSVSSTNLRAARSVVSPTPASPPHASSHSLADDDVASLGASKAGSIYSLSRVSFTSRLAQLTSIPLPSPSSLQARISSQTTAHLSARTLSEAGDQIRLWTKKAADVLQDLDAQDDVEWSAAGGKDGLEEVDQAISRFEGLVKVYVISVEELQMRSDVKTLSDETLHGHVEQMEGVVTEWAKIKQSLKAVKNQVEIALEWEELWNSVLGETAQELNALSDLIFEMEEQRHRSLQATAGADVAGRDDVNKLADALARRPHLSTPNKSPAFSAATLTANSPMGTPNMPSDKDDAKLLGLFARMQPLRAALDFLPMRLSAFYARGSALFPTGCEELEARRNQLEEQWTKVETDAEALRKELGEDKWLTVFRNAGRQALKMFESVERSMEKLNQAIADGVFERDPNAFAHMVESFEAKKTHYVPAIDRVLGLIDKGVMDRLSVNGEILRLQADMKLRHKDLKASIAEVDDMLDNAPVDAQGHQLRDSISTILSSERSQTGSALDSPRSSPASSVMMRSRNGSLNGQITPTARPAKSSILPKTRRTSAIGPATPSGSSRLSEMHRSTTSPLPQTREPYTGRSVGLFRDFKNPENKPRWSSSGNTTATARDFAPLSATTPSPYSNTLATQRKYTPTRSSQLPTTSNRGKSPAPDTPSSSRRLSASRLPPRASSALEQRSVSSSAAQQSTPPKRREFGGRLQPPSTPLTSRKYSGSSKLATVQDEDDAASISTQASSRRPVTKLYASRSPGSQSTATPETSTKATAGASATTSVSSKTTTAGRRISSLAGTSTPSRKPRGLLTPSGIWSRGSPRDSRAGIPRAASAMGLGKGAEEDNGRPRWRF